MMGGSGRQNNDYRPLKAAKLALRLKWFTIFNRSTVTRTVLRFSLLTVHPSQKKLTLLSVYIFINLQAGKL